ncbi:hypothetical protein EVC03_082 [Rhizobium phage RHph_Y5A]|nr:hypothetical protein EVC03_082 [Rhizobium phage RHph_Y5A]QIG75524.1 hypothetical protein EVC18_082 [Rhizobium phage RHph_Y2_4]
MVKVHYMANPYYLNAAHIVVVKPDSGGMTACVTVNDSYYLCDETVDQVIDLIKAEKSR